MARGKRNLGQVAQEQFAELPEEPQISREQEIARDSVLRRSPTPAHGQRPADFSCRLPGCPVRTSRVTDPAVFYDPKTSIWFCSEDHARRYGELRYGS